MSTNSRLPLMTKWDPADELRWWTRTSLSPAVQMPIATFGTFVVPVIHVTRATNSFNYAVLLRKLLLCHFHWRFRAQTEVMGVWPLPYSPIGLSRSCSL